MPVSVTVRDVPQSVRDELAARAAQTGKSLQEYLRSALIELAARPTMESFVAQVRSRLAVTGSELDAQQVLAARDADRR